ncbi:MAG: hypothetical protein PWP24_946 [Clostridiales bacterium]|nr:hypothetical protein [Clostridiales bacterium]
MKLIFGGAYQGKLAYAKERYSIKETDIYRCQADCSILKEEAFVIYGLEKLILSQTREGIDTIDYLRERKEMLRSSIIICEDNSCGIVPMERELRVYRETCGRALTMLSLEADEVIRVFCGIGSRLK